MRDIKFRAWDKKSKTMVMFGDSTLSNTGGFWNIESGDNREVYCLEFTAVLGECNSGAGYFHHDFAEQLTDYELMQYTGLKDKNGTEIYEGDICSFTTKDGDKYIIKMHTLDKFHFWNEVYFNMVDKNEVLLENNPYEVIGNIYENPELLK